MPLSTKVRFTEVNIMPNVIAKARGSTFTAFVRKYKKELIVGFALVAVMAMIGFGFASQGTNTLWEATESAGNDLIKNLRRFYCYTAFPILLVINLLGMAFTKDERMIAVIKKALIIEAIVFIGIFAIAAIRDTLIDVASKVDSNAVTEMKFSSPAANTIQEGLNSVPTP